MKHTCEGKLVFIETVPSFMQIFWHNVESSQQSDFLFMYAVIVD